jgi:hypothetical protein
MPLSPAPIQEPIVGVKSVLSAIWVQWFDKLRRELYTAPPYTVATLPTNVVAGSMSFVSNESGGSVLAFFDGSNWRRVTDRAIVS